MKERKSKSLFYSMILLGIASILSIVTTFAWFVSSKKSAGIQISGDADISISAYALKFYAADNVEHDIFVPDGGKYPADLMDESTSLVGDEGSLDDLDNRNYLKLVFVITNNSSKNDCDISLRLSNFIDNVFTYYDDFVSEYASIKSSGTSSFTKNSDVKTLARQYNAKFSLYFDEVRYCIGNDYDSSDESTFSRGLTMNDITISSNPFLWKYGVGDRVFDGSEVSNKVTIPASGTITLELKIKTQQSNESINGYRNWLINDYGNNYLSINKYDNSFNGLTTQQKAYINDYLNYYVDSEIQTIYTESSTVSQETKLLINYFEVIGEVK